MSCSRNHITKSKCSAKNGAAFAETLKDFVSDYMNNHDLHRDWSRSLSIPEAVFGDPRFSSAKKFPDQPNDKEWDYFSDNVKINSHQRLPINIDKNKQWLQKIAKHLAAKWNRNSFKDFEDLYEYVFSILVITSNNPNGLVRNPYALIIYDIALRLAYRYGVWPKDYVYLNGSGPNKGVKALGLNKYITKGQRKTILRSYIIKHYPELEKLDAAQLEDFLCIYHNELNNFKRKIRS